MTKPEKLRITTQKLNNILLLPSAALLLCAFQQWLSPVWMVPPILHFGLNIFVFFRKASK